MNIKQIRYFVAVFDTGSLSAAAKQQFVTVQAMSKAVSNLEKELNGELFYRESRGVRATPLGHNFYARAVVVLHEFDKLEDFAYAYRTGSEAAVLRIALATPTFYGNEIACEKITAFFERGLGVHAVATMEDAQTAAHGLRTGMFDLAIMMGAYEHPDFDSLALGAVAPSLIMSPQHPLAQEDCIHLQDLKPYPILLTLGREDFNASLIATFHQRQPDLTFVRELPQDFEAFLIKERGLALTATIPALGTMHPWAVQRSIASNEATPIPICLISTKHGKSPLYVRAERWLSNEFILLSSKMWNGLDQ